MWKRQEFVRNANFNHNLEWNLQVFATSGHISAQKDNKLHELVVFTTVCLQDCCMAKNYLKVSQSYVIHSMCCIAAQLRFLILMGVCVNAD